MTLSLENRVAAAADLPILARMNQQLIEDKGHFNQMNLAKLETRTRLLGTGRRTGFGS